MARRLWSLDWDREVNYEIFTQCRRSKLDSSRKFSSGETGKEGVRRERGEREKSEEIEDG